MGEGAYNKHQCAHCMKITFLRESDPLATQWTRVKHANADGSVDEYELDSDCAIQFAGIAQKQDTELAVWLKTGQKGESDE